MRRFSGKAVPSDGCLSGAYATFALVFILLLASCASKPGLIEKGMTVAVWDLDDLSPTEGTRTDLGQLLSAQIIEILKQKEDLTLLERERLLLALEELRLGTTALADEETRLKLGRIVGARLMVFGGYQIIGDQMRLDLRLIDVETGKVRKAVQKIAQGTGVPVLLDAVRKAAGELL